MVAAMREHYDKWRVRVEPLFGETRSIRIGSDRSNPLMLYSSDWDGEYADSPGNLAKGTATGAWHVLVEEDAEYEFELRRWPKESGLALNAPIDAENPKSARPIAKARLWIGDFDQTLDTPDGATAATFAVPLNAGKTLIQTWFLDANGEVLCSAFYAQVSKR